MSDVRWSGGRTTATAVFVMVAVLTGCSDDQSSAPPAEQTSAKATATSPTPSPTPAPTGPKLPQDCDQLIDYTVVLDAAGGVLEGESTFVFAGPLESGRTGRITCGYGVVAGADGKPGPPKIEVTLNGYDTEETAQFRFDFSIGRAREQGQRIESVDLDGRPAVLLSNAEDTSMIALEGNKTMVITILAGVVPEPAIKPALFEIAAAVLKLTPVASPTD